MADFLTIFKGNNFCDFLFCHFVHQTPSEKGSTIKGKNFLPRGEFLPFGADPFSEGRQNNFKKDYHIRPKYPTVRLGFSKRKKKKKALVKYVPTYTNVTL